jgi:anti-sigma B factor antagonist
MRPLPITEKDGVLVIALEDGESLNEGQAVALRQSLYTSLETKKEPRVAIDLSAVDYITSSGIALLIGTKRRVEAKQGRLVLCGLRPDIRDLFAVMKLVDLFDIADDEAGAIGLLSSPLPN